MPTVKTLKAALIGNPNVGKTTLFNNLTNSTEYVGNWAGVTIDKKIGHLKDIADIVDLPGIYGLDAFSNEEKISKEYLENEDVDVILNIVDASNLEKNLYLTTQLKQFNKPIILVLNMVDVAKVKGIKIDIKALSNELGMPIVEIVANKRNNIDELISLIQKTKNNDKVVNFNYNYNKSEDIYNYIDGILSRCVNKASLKATLSEKIDNIVLNPILAYPIFLLLLFLMFKVTFSWIGQPISDLLDGFFSDTLTPWVADLLQNSAPWFQSLVSDGIIGGVGSVLVLLPVILSLYVCITILEDTGYMSRVAFIMDSLMRKMGLSGKAFIPMIIGFGCSVPAVMSTRTLESEKDRKLATLLAPLMSCNARLTIYAVFAATFFPGHEPIVMLGLYLLSIVLAFVLGIIFKNTIFKKDEEPFVLELHDYKVPVLKGLLKSTYQKASGFVKKAGTLIFAVSIIVWFASNFNFHGMCDLNDSILAKIGGFIAPVFKPLGYGNWEASVSLITGIMAKEVVVGTMGSIYGGDLQAILPSHFTVVSAISFIIFVALYTPCVSVIGAIKREYGTKMTLFSVVYQLVVAWVVSFIAYNVLSLFIK